MRRIIKLVGLNERGAPIGDGHHNARLTDGEVELMRMLHEAGGVSYAEVGRRFDVTPRTARLICQYKVRCQTPMAFKEVGYMVDEERGELPA